MKAAVITGPGETPVYGDFEAPLAKAEEQVIAMRAAALSNFTRGRASGTHYSASGTYGGAPPRSWRQ